jgi:two-component system, cell cycle sensor histidine kinase and response regulator CckA
MDDMQKESEDCQKTGKSHLDSPDMYRAAIESSPDSFFLADRKGRILDVNDAYVRRSGFTREELLSMRIPDLEANKGAEETATHIEKIFREGNDLFEVLHRTKGGEIWQAEVNAAYRQIDGGRIFWFMRDITADKQEEECLRKNAEKLRAFLNNISDTVWLIDASLNMAYVSPSVTRLMGFLPGEIIGRPSAFVIHPDDMDVVSDAQSYVMGHPGKPHTVQYRVSHKDGRWIYVESTGVNMLDNPAINGVLVTMRDITMRKRAEEEIAERGAMLQQIMDTASVAIGLVDMTGRITHANRRMAEMFGRTLEELLGCEYVELVHPSERETGRKKMLALLASEVPYVDLERLYRRKDGTEFWGHLACRRFHDVRGNELGLIGVITDIDKRRRVEQKLRESESRLNTILDNVGAAIFIKDTQYRYTYVNRKVCEIFGKTPEAILGKGDDAFFSKHSFEEIMLSDRPVIEQGETIAREEVGLTSADGLSCTYWTVKLPLRDSSGAITGLCGISTDITELKRAEEALRESENLLRESQIIAGLGSYILDIPTGLWTGTDVLDNVFGIDGVYERSVEGWAALIHPDDRTMMIDYFRNEVIGHGKSFDKEYRIIRYEDQAERWVHGSGKLEFDTQGRPVKMYGTIQDITGRKKLEEQIRQNQKLESIGTLAGGIAHDFNNLLQGVFGYISLAKVNYDQKEKSLAMLEQAEKALHMSVNLTTQLLTFSKGGKPVKKLIRLRPAIENSVKFALSGSHTNYEMDVPADLWSVEADEGQLAQVIQNIVLNANEAMAGSGTVRVSMTNMEIAKDMIAGLPDGGQFVRIAIQDSGIGIPEQNLAKIFDPYFTTKQKGSGLGLATSYSIIKNHDGLIEVTSALNRGTTFTIYLPASRRAEIQTSAASTASGTKKGRILVMDDEELVRNVAREMLAALGHDVVTAEDGKKAIELFQEARVAGTPFDLVILDLTVKGGMGGEEAIRKIRDIDPSVKAVVSSGYSDSPAIANYSEYGFSAVLNKPFMIDTLQKCLNLLTT